MEQQEKSEEAKDATKTNQIQENSETTVSSSSSSGWGGGWRFSSFSVLSDLQKAAEEISKNAVAVAKNAAKSLTDGIDVSESESSSAKEEEKDDEKEDSKDEKLRDSALNRLENASQETLLGQGLKVLDDSVESLASGAWLALGSAWKGGSTLVQKLEHSAVSLADSIQHGALPVNASSLAPSIIETGKKGIQVLERVGKETMDLLITETGLNVDKEFGRLADDGQFEEINFERCFYIYGGPEQLEELEALSNHYALLFNRKKAKLLSEQKSYYDGKLKQIQQILNMRTELEENSVDSDKGKHLQMSNDASGIEMKNLHDSSVSKAADLAAGFAAALEGLAMNDITQRTTDRLETAHTEGVHRISELCSFAVSNLLMLGKSIISIANKKSEETEVNIKVDWPEDSDAKAKVIRSRAKYMSRDVESVASSFITGVSEIIEAYQTASKSVSSSNNDRSISDKANMITNHFHAGQTSALDKIQDALQHLTFVVVTTSMPST